MSIVNYKYHKIKKLHNLLFKTDEPFDWFVHAKMRRMRAEEALSGEVMRRNNEKYQKARQYAIVLHWSKKLSMSFVDVENMADQRAYYWYDDFRPQEVKDWARHLQSLFHQAVKKDGWNEVTKTSFRTWLKHEPGGSVQQILVSKDTYLNRRKGTPYFGLELLRSIPYKYRTKVIGFKAEYYDGRLWNYYPVFDAETQKEWDDAQRRFDEGATRYYAEKASGGYCGD